MLSIRLYDFILVDVVRLRLFIIATDRFGY